MIRLGAPPELQPENYRGGWELWLFAGDSFDFNTPFREMLAFISQVLGQNPATDLTLPEHEENEDFVEGTLHFGDRTFDLYFEHSLNYLSIMHADRVCLEEVMRAIMPHVVVQ